MSSSTSASATALRPSSANAVLVMADGSVYYGQGIGKQGIIAGEICFNTAMTGYQEILTDPSYAGQIITFTFPHIGNVGVNKEDIESANVGTARGLILRETITPESNFRAEDSLSTWLEKKGITGITGLDTRAITRKIRLQGPQNVVIAYGDLNDIALDDLHKKAKEWPELDEFDLTREVSTKEARVWQEGAWALNKGYEKPTKQAFHVVALDFGAKYNTLRRLTERGCKVTLLPANATAEQILKHKPDGVFLSNGPGDPVTTAEFTTPVIQKIIEQNIPLFGICLGQQLIALALGGKTEKMRQGHRGANHPIRHNSTGRIEITSQNHGYVVSHGSLPANAEVTHISLFDGTIAGIRLKDKPVFAVQYHPESSPGPHDSRYLFDQFIDMLEKAHSQKKVKVS